MKIYVITRFEKTENGGAFLKSSEICISKVEAIKWIHKDIKFEKEILDNEFEEYIKDDEIGYYIYRYKNEILGNSKVEYQIWEKEL